MMSIPDSIDKGLVRLLGQDGRQNSEALAKQLNISSATVRRRLRNLIKDGALRFIGIVDPAKFGFPVAVMITLDVAHDKLQSAMEKLSNYPETRWVSTTTGRFDIITLARFSSNDSLSKFMVNELSQLEGVKDIETFICLDVKKGGYIPFSTR
jgi:DNA-binding Lrp family transcriptional regulator